MSDAEDRPTRPAAWFVYILRCANGNFYTGVTTDVARRVSEHQSGGRRAARFTRSFAPVELVYQCRIGSRRMACRIEYRIKRLPREKKAWLVYRNVALDRLMDVLGI